MLRILAMMLALVVFPAAGQTVQKCVGKGGAITMTSGACPAGQREAATYDATPRGHDRGAGSATGSGSSAH